MQANDDQVRSFILFQRQVMNLANDKAVSIKGSVFQFYNDKLGLYCKRKIIWASSSLQLRFYQKNLKQFKQNTHNELQNRLSYFTVEVKESKNQILVVQPFINSLSIVRTLLELPRLSLSKMEDNKIALLLKSLIETLVDDGNRPFMPTCENIYIGGNNILINDSSVVGTAFIQFKKSISKSDFREICPLLPSDIFVPKNKPTNYVRIKQRAFIVFFLALLTNREPCFLFPNEIGQTMTVAQAQILLKTQKERMAKYLANKSISAAIDRFQRAAKLSIRKLADYLFVQEGSMSWPQFFRQLTGAKEPHSRVQQLQQQLQLQQLQPPKQLKLQKILQSLTAYHWNKLPLYAKRKLMSDGAVSTRGESDTLEREDTDFFLFRLTQTPLRLLLQQQSMTNVLMKTHSFCKLIYNLWNSLLKLLPLEVNRKQNDLHSYQKSHDSNIQFDNSQSHQVLQNNIVSLDKQNSAQCILQSNTQQYLQLGSPSLFQEDKKIGFDFLLELGQRMLSNRFLAQSAQITIRHQKIKSITQFTDSFR